MKDDLIFVTLGFLLGLLEQSDNQNRLLNAGVSTRSIRVLIDDLRIIRDELRNSGK